MKKVGIMGGTFNPIHYAHLILAESAYEQYDLDEIIFLPSNQPAYKSLREIVSNEHRKNMIQLAIEDNPHFSFSTVEFEREGNTYTADTLLQLTKEYPDVMFYFIIGGDSLFQLEHWNRPEVVLSLAKILAAGRGEKTEDEMLIKIDELNEKYQSNIQFLKVPTFDISSKMIRNHLKKGNSVKYFLPEKVISYINENNLYK